MKENSEKKELNIESLPTEESNKLNQEKMCLNLQGEDNLITQREKKSNLKVNSAIKEKKTVHFRGDDNKDQPLETVIIISKDDENEKKEDENKIKKDKTKCKCCCFIF